MTTYRVCFCFRRRFRPASSDPPEEIKLLFGQYSENGMMGVQQLQRFLVEVQGEAEATQDTAQEILDGQKEFRHRKRLSLDAFFHFLFTEDNSPICPALGVHQDMKAPLSHYFIFTGHNSYLTGNQLSSDCSDVPIIESLERGVRVVELDMWPDSKKDDVDIKHGGTLTAPVELIKCLRSIKEHAFDASPYPVIVTLEDHLTPDLQAKVAKMINGTFGAMLFAPNSELKEFPSPEELKMRIIISTKAPKEYLETKTARENLNEMKNEPEEGAWGTEIPDLGNSKKLEQEQSEHYQEEDDPHDEQRSQQVAAPEYKKLIAISAIKRKGGMSEMLKIDPNKVMRLSLSEPVFEKAAISHGTDLIRFTQKNMLRIYPRGTRVTSSNYNPLLGWMHGAQMVALNMQGYGRSLWLMHGMFRANGGCGYVKKPDILLKNDPNGKVFDPKAPLPIKTILKVKVYMGDGWRCDFRRTHFDVYSPPDFYTRVGIAGVPADSVMRRTKAIEDNWTPMWNEEFSFPLRVPELALLRVEVHEYDMSEKDDFGGQTCLPVWELRSGIRSVQLCDRKGRKYKSVKLLMRFDFEQVW